MSYFGSSDYYADVALGKVPGAEIVRQFGDATVGTTYSPVTASLTYQTPIAATSLEAVSSSAADGVAGAGALTLTVIGLDTNWAEITQTVTMNGTTAVAIPTPLLRMYEAYVATSGTYAGPTAGGSHVGNITIRTAGAGATWGLIEATPWPGGQTTIACYTVPLGKTAYLLWKVMNAESTKVVDVRFFHRPFANDVTTPFTGTLRQVEREANAVGESTHKPVAPVGPFVGPCDLGFLAKVSVGTAVIACEFQLLVTTP